MTGGGGRRLLLVLAIAAAVAAAAGCAREEPFYLGGIQVNEPDVEAWLDALEAAGMNTVAVTDYARQGDWDGANLWWDEERGALPEIRAARRRGMRVVLVLRVALDHAFPRNRFLWHGMIQPADDALLAEWFARYRRFVVEWAEIAEREGVDLLVVGSEMNALASTMPVPDTPALEAWYLDPAKREERRAAILAHGDEIESRHLWQPGRREDTDLATYLDERFAVEAAWARRVTGGGAEPSLAAVNRRRRILDRHWRRLVAAVRGVYRGPLGYAANFDQYDQVGFWPALDVMGINAYFALREDLEPALGDPGFHDALVAGWRRVLGEIEAFRVHHQLDAMPVVLTEMGFTWRRHSTLRPWADAGFSLLEDGAGPPALVVWRDQPPAPEERALAIRALHQAHRELATTRGDTGWLAGILYWKLSTQPTHRDVESFVLVLGENDPAEPELRRFVDG